MISIEAILVTLKTTIQKNLEISEICKENICGRVLLVRFSSIEHRAKNNDHEAKINKQRAKSNEQ